MKLRKIESFFAERKKLGALGERIAAEHLKKRGYEILETNFRCPFGEIDIIARQKEFLVFVEVRTKRSPEFGLPEESITSSKRRKLIQLANAYLQTHKAFPSLWRIDVVAVELGADGKVSRVKLIENALS
jgi:putative endonuclease